MSDINDLTCNSLKIYNVLPLSKQIISVFQNLNSKILLKCLENQPSFSVFSANLQIKSRNLLFFMTIQKINRSQNQQLSQFQINLKQLKEQLWPKRRELTKDSSKLQFLKVVNFINEKNYKGYQINVQSDLSDYQILFFVKKRLKILNAQIIKQTLKQLAQAIDKMYYQLIKFVRFKTMSVKNKYQQLKNIRENFMKQKGSIILAKQKLVCKNFLSYQIEKQKTQQQEAKQKQQYLKKREQQKMELLTRHKKQQQQSQSENIVKTIQFSKKSKALQTFMSSYSVLTKVKASFRNFNTLIFFKNNYIQEGGNQIYKRYINQSQFVQKFLACKQVIRDVDQIKQIKSAQASLKNQKQFLIAVNSQKCKHIGRFYFDLKQRQNFENNTNAKIYLEWEESDLQNFFIKNKKFSLYEYLSFTIQILKGLYFMQQMGYVHRDIKLANIVISKDKTVRLIDFGSVYPIYKKKPNDLYILKCSKFDATPRLTPEYAITLNKIKQKFPQIAEKYDSASYNRHKLFDMYAFGLIFKKLVLKQKFEFQKLDKQLQENIKFIIQTCINPDPQKRMNPDEVILFIQKLQKILQLNQKASHEQIIKKNRS